MKPIRIGDFEISKNSATFIIAEAGVNHNGDLSMAKELCKVAKKAGANAVKFQTWKTDQLVTTEVRTAPYQKKVTSEKSQYDMLKKLELSFDEFREISDYCKRLGIIFLSTPGDAESANFLKELGIPAFKIGSDDMDNYPLIKEVAETGKPLIISTGMSTMKEVQEMLDFVKKFNDKIILLHCTSNYPTEITEVNLNAMCSMMKILRVFAGYSDHTTNIWIPSLAVSMGAKLVEKHITIDKHLLGPDHKTSLDPEDFSEMIMSVRKVESLLKNKKFKNKDISELISNIFGRDIKRKIVTAMGSSEKKPTKAEKKIGIIVKKTIVAIKNIKKGKKFSNKNISIMRAGVIALRPKEYFQLLDRSAKIDIKKGEIITYEKVI